MPPRLPSILPQSRGSSSIGSRWARLFSSTSNARAENDPHKALLDSIAPAKAPRPDNGSLESRGPNSLPADSSNPSLHSFPSTNDKGTKSPLTTARDSMISRQRSPQPGSRESGLSASGVPLLGAKQARLLEQQLHRPMRYGDVYAPHDLSPAEQVRSKYAASSRAQARRKPNTRKHGRPDELDVLNINPVDHYKNFSMMSEFVSTMGRIRHGRETGFRAVNQRRMAKAVRRAIGIGIMPSVHRHPELMADRIRQRAQINVQSPLSGYR